MRRRDPPQTPIRTGLPTVAWLLVQRARGNTSSGLLCRSCGYEVTNLPSNICPECGANLKDVGVVPPALIKRWPFIIGVFVAWTALIWTGSVYLSPLITSHLYPDVHVPADVERSWEPASRSYRFISLRAEGHVDPFVRGQSPPPVKVITVHITPRDSPYPAQPSFAIDPQTMTMESRSKFYDYSSPIGPAEPAPQAAFEQWWRDCGLDPDDPQQQTELSALWTLIDAATGLNAQQFTALVERTNMPGLRYSHGGTGRMIIGPPEIVKSILGWSSLALWIAGLLIFWLISRRRPNRSVA